MMLVRAGDVFRIQDRHDRGGFQFIKVTRVYGRHVFVVDLYQNGKPVERPERKLGNYKRTARQQLRGFWKRSSLPLSETAP